MKRLSALAQLVAIHQANGITTTAALATKTGYSERQIWRARTELTDTRDPDADVRDPDARVTDNPDARVSNPPTENGGPYKESILRIDTLSQEREEKVDSATAAATAAKKFAFQGRVIRLTQADFDRWRKAYPSIVDLGASLQAADDYYAEKPPSDGKWFFRVSRWLATENSRAKEGSSGRPFRRTERVYDPEFLRLIGCVAQ